MKNTMVVFDDTIIKEQAFGLLQPVLDSLEEACFIVDRSGIVILANKEAEEYFIVSKDTPQSMHISGFLSGLDTKQVKKLLNGSGKGLKKHLLEKNSPIKYCKYQYAELTVSPVDVPDGKYHFFKIRDLGFFRQIKKILRYNEQDFETLVEKSFDIIIRFDRNCKCVYANETFEKTTGYSCFDVIGFTPEKFKFTIDIDSKLLTRLLKKVVETGKKIEFDFDMVHAINCLRLSFKVKLVPVLNMDKTVLEVLLIGQDITNIKKKEEELVIEKRKAEENARLKSFFLALISHEIRTPLNAIVGFSRLIKDGMTYVDEDIDLLDMIYSSGMKLINMVERLIDLSKVESGQVDLCYSYFDLYDFLIGNYEPITEMMDSSNKNKNIQIKLLGHEELAENKISIFSDQNRIKQILESLVENAIKFTEEGEIVIGVEFQEPVGIIFYVSDTGIGIPKEKFEIIFESFTQVQDTYSRIYDGMGIGLSSARKIARALNGDITLSSEKGKGSTFYLYLPLRKIDSENVVKEID